MENEQVDFSDFKKRMRGSLASFRSELTGLRTDRASTAALEPVTVSAYGSNMPLNQVATISLQDARMAVVQVWDTTLVTAVDKAIRNANLGLNPMAEGTTLRIPFPLMTAERRQEMVKIAHKYAEQAKVGVRNIRRDGMDHLKKLEKDGEINKDDYHHHSEQLQKIIDQFIKDIDDIMTNKENEILTL